MYPIKIGFDEAIKRIEKLSKNGHHAESLVTSIFTVEKTLKRTLKQLVISCGFKNTIADEIIEHWGFYDIKKYWSHYDPKHENLISIISAGDWKTIADNIKKRNKLVHGQRVYKLDECERDTKDIIKALKNIKATLENRYGYSGWQKNSIRRISKLHVDPKIKM